MAEVSGSESNDRSEPYDEAPVYMASKVFISYPSQDVAVADTCARHLRRRACRAGLRLATCARVSPMALR
jgi:hypothetical protein